MTNSSSYMHIDLLKSWISCPTCGGGEVTQPGPLPGTWSVEERREFLDWCWGLVQTSGQGVIGHHFLANLLVWPAVSAIFYFDDGATPDRCVGSAPRVDASEAGVIRERPSSSYPEHLECLGVALCMVEGLPPSRYGLKPIDEQVLYTDLGSAPAGAVRTL